MVERMPMKCVLSLRDTASTTDAKVVEISSNPHRPCKPMMVSLLLTINLEEIQAFKVHYVE